MSQDKMPHWRQLVPSQARTWIGTKFHHQGRSKKLSDKKPGGVDCIGLIVGVADELQITDGNGTNLTDYDFTTYSRLGTGKRLIDILDSHLDRVVSMQPGDVLLFRLFGQPQHVGIVGKREGDLSLIHAYETNKSVVEHDLSQKWLNRVLGIYRFRSE